MKRNSGALKPAMCKLFCGMNTSFGVSCFQPAQIETNERSGMSTRTMAYEGAHRTHGTVLCTKLVQRLTVRCVGSKTVTEMECFDWTSIIGLASAPVV